MKTIRIGTRGSPLAMVQARMVRDLLVKQGLSCEICVIKTTGDWAPEDGEVLLETKGDFAKEIEQALLDGDIDLAVHSMKDMETVLPDGLVIRHMLPREDVRDCLLFSSDLVKNSQKIKEGMRVGTASVRRRAFLLNKYPDLNVETIRGNVQTRIEKVRAGQVDVTLLAMAGLRRLGLLEEADVILELDEMLPSVGQGAIGIEIRAEDDGLSAVLDRVSCLHTLLCVSAERAALRVLDGSCHTPIGAYAAVGEDGEMDLRLCLASLDGAQMFHKRGQQSVSDLDVAEEFGAEMGQRLKEIVPAVLLRQVIGV